MTILIYLAPNARWQARNAVGQPLPGGKLYTNVAGTEVPKTTYSDPAGIIPNPNPVIFDAKGEANIYWQKDSENPTLYKIKLTDSFGNIIYTQDDYPTLSDTHVDPTINVNVVENFVRNPQFTYWIQSTTDLPNVTQSSSLSDYLANDWLFLRSNTTATVNISQRKFNLGQIEVPGNPVGYLHYECGNAIGAGETYKHFAQIYPSVQTLSGQKIQFSIFARSDNNDTVSFKVVQSFGTGGSPSADVVTTITTAQLSSAWAQYIGSITVPSVNGKTLGTNGGDYLALTLDMPLNTLATSVDLCIVQFQPGEKLTNFSLQSLNNQILDLTSEIYDATFKTGDVKFSLRSSAEAGWLMCDDGTIGSSLSGANHVGLATKFLYSYLWNDIPNIYAPIFNSDGTVGTRGVSAILDYQANKRLALTRILGRVLGSATGAHDLSVPFTASTSTSILTLPAANSFYTGMAVALLTTGTLPSPLAPATTYYVISISTTEIKLATSLANALAGTAITLTTTGSGTNFVAHTYPARPLGLYEGEYVHNQAPSELVAHFHNYTITNPDNFGQSTGGPDPQYLVDPHLSFNNTPTTSSGLSVPFNITQPTVYLNCMIKL